MCIRDSVGLIEVGIVYTVIDRIRNTIEIGVRNRFGLRVCFELIGQLFTFTMLLCGQTRVGVQPAVGRIVAALAEDSVVASATAEFVSPGATEYQVGTVVAFEQVIAVPPRMVSVPFWPEIESSPDPPYS